MEYYDDSDFSPLALEIAKALGWTIKLPKEDDMGYSMRKVSFSMEEKNGPGAWLRFSGYGIGKGKLRVSGIGPSINVSYNRPIAQIVSAIRSRFIPANLEAWNKRQEKEKAENDYYTAKRNVTLEFGKIFGDNVEARYAARGRVCDMPVYVNTRENGVHGKLDCSTDRVRFDITAPLDIARKIAALLAKV